MLSGLHILLVNSFVEATSAPDTILSQHHNHESFRTLGQGIILASSAIPRNRDKRQDATST